MDNHSIYSPLHTNEQELVIRTYDLVHKGTGGLNTIGSISFAVQLLEEPKNLFSKETPQMPIIPDMTPAVASAIWVRIWQIAKLFMDLFDYARFAVSWKIPLLSLSVVIVYYSLIFMFDSQYIHLYLFTLVIAVLYTTFLLRKKHLIAKTIQTNEADKNSSYYVGYDF